MTEQTTMPETRIVELATPYTACIYFEYDDLKNNLDSFWRANEEVLVKELKIKTMKLKNGSYKNAQQIAEKNHGYTKIYGQLLYDLTLRKLKSEGVDVLFVEQLDLRGYADEKPWPYTIIKYYNNPIIEGVSKDDLDFVVKRESKWDREELRVSRLKSLQDKHKSYVKTEDGKVREHCRVLLDLAYKDKDHIDVKNKWHDVTYMSSPMKDRLLESELGDSFEITLQENGKDLGVIVQVHEVHDVIMPSVDEALEKEGFETREDFDKAFDESFDNDLKRSDMDQAVVSIINQLMFGPGRDKFPAQCQPYIDANVGQEVDQFIEVTHKGNLNNAMQAVGAVTEEQLYNKFNGEFMRKFMQNICLRTFAHLCDIDKDDYQAIYDEIYTSCSFVDPE